MWALGEKKGSPGWILGVGAGGGRKDPRRLQLLSSVGSLWALSGRRERTWGDPGDGTPWMLWHSGIPLLVHSKHRSNRPEQMERRGRDGAPECLAGKPLPLSLEEEEAHS